MLRGKSRIFAIKRLCINSFYTLYPANFFSNTCLPVLKTLKYAIINNINAWNLRNYTQHRNIFYNSSITRKITRPCLFAFLGLIPWVVLCFLHMRVSYLNEANQFQKVAIKDMIPIRKWVYQFYWIGRLSNVWKENSTGMGIPGKFPGI